MFGVPSLLVCGGGPLSDYSLSHLHGRDNSYVDLIGVPTLRYSDLSGYWGELPKMKKISACSKDIT